MDKTIRDKHYESNFEFPLLKMIMQRAEEKDISISEAAYDVLPEWNKKRRENARLYDQLLADIPQVQTPVVPEKCEHSYLHYVIKAENRDELKDFLMNKQDIQCKIIYSRPVYLGTVYRERFGFKAGDFPISENLCQEILGIPVQPFLTDEQIQYVVDSIRTFYRTN